MLALTCGSSGSCPIYTATEHAARSQYRYVLTQQGDMARLCVLGIPAKEGVDLPIGNASIVFVPATDERNDLLFVGPPDSILYNSDADWVAPSAWISPTRSCGSGQPPCKVNINDSDHSHFGMWDDSPRKYRNYAWQNFLTGNQVLFMDPYLARAGRTFATILAISCAIHASST